MAHGAKELGNVVKVWILTKILRNFYMKTCSVFFFFYTFATDYRKVKDYKDLN